MSFDDELFAEFCVLLDDVWIACWRDMYAEERELPTHEQPEVGGEC